MSGVCVCVEWEGGKALWCQEEHLGLCALFNHSQFRLPQATAVAIFP